MVNQKNPNDTNESFLGDLPWPKKGDKLFLNNPDAWWISAFASSQSSAIYSTGYKRAADILALHVQADDREVNFLVFPIIFMYRQYLELQLKEIIRDGQCLEGEKKIFQRTMISLSCGDRHEKS